MQFPSLMGLAFMACLLAGLALAQESSSIVEEVVVTATRSQSAPSAIPGTVTVLPEDLIRSRAAISDDLASVLSASVPGFAPSSQKLAGRGETLRGRNPLYLIDGIPQHNALRDGQRDGHTIDLAFIERIEVINGSNAIQGVGATGGVVNMITRSPASSESWSGTVNARLSAADDFDSDSLGMKIAATAGRRLGNIDVSLGASWNERGLFFDADGHAVGLYPTQGDIMDSQSVSLFGKAAWQLNEDHELTLMLNDFDLERNGDFRAVPGDRALGIKTGTEAGDPSATVGNPARNEVTTVSLTWRGDNVFGGSVELQAYDQSYRALFEGGTFGNFFRLTPDGDPFLDQSAIESDKRGIKSTWNRTLNDSLALTTGLDIYRDDSAQVLARSGREWVPETRFESVAPFAQLTWDVTEAVTLAGGLRHENASVEVANYVTIAAAGSTPVAGGSPDFSDTLFNVSALWRANENWRLYVARSEGFTMPDVGRVLRGVSTPGRNVDDLINLEPIITDNTEVGVEWQLEQVELRLSVFESTADNGARLFSNPQGIFEVQRQKTEISGVEVSAQWALTTSLNAGASLAITNGEFDSDDNGSVDSDLDGLNIGPDRLNAYLDGRTSERLRWRVQVSHLRDRSFSGVAAPSDRDFDGYTIADAFIGWQLPLGEVNIAVENLLNEDYFTYFAQTEPAARSDTFFKGNGRTVSVGWRLDF